MFKQKETLSPELSIYFNSLDEYNQVIKDLLQCIEFHNIDWFDECGISNDHVLRAELIEVKIMTYLNLYIKKFIYCEDSYHFKNLMNKIEYKLSPKIDFESEYFNSLKMVRQRYRNSIPAPALRNYVNFQDK
jgi:hypothetical protein